jgi:hypothetical protein
LIIVPLSGLKKRSRGSSTGTIHRVIMKVSEMSHRMMSITDGVIGYKINDRSLRKQLFLPEENITAKKHQSELKLSLNLIGQLSHFV